MPGGSEPLTWRRTCRTDTREGEGPALIDTGELFRRAIVEGAVRPVPVVVTPPALDLVSSILQIKEDFQVQAFVA